MITSTTVVATDWNALLIEALALETQGHYLASILLYEIIETVFVRQNQGSF